MNNELLHIASPKLVAEVLPALVRLEEHYSFEEQAQMFVLIGHYLGEHLAPCLDEKALVGAYIDGTEPTSALSLFGKSPGGLEHMQIQLVVKIINAIGDASQRTHPLAARRLWAVARDFAKSLERRQHGVVLSAWFDYLRRCGVSSESVQRVHLV